MNNQQIAMQLQSAIIAAQQQDISDCRARFDVLRADMAAIAAHADLKVRTYKRSVPDNPYAAGVYDYARFVAAVAHDAINQSKETTND